MHPARPLVIRYELFPATTPSGMRDKIVERPAGRSRGVRYKDDADIADYLEVIRKEDEERFFTYLTRLPPRLQAETVIELPRPFQADLVERQDPESLATLVGALATDNATDFMQLVAEVDRDKAEAIFERLDDELEQIIRRLMTYGPEEAGSVMQTEVFSARLDETVQHSLTRLRRLKEHERLKHVQYVLVVDEHNRLVRVIPLAELILVPPRRHYRDIVAEFNEPWSVQADSPLEEAIRAIDRYDLTVLPVVDRRGHLLGQITHDDVVDLIQRRATEQMYGLGRVSAGEQLHAGVGRTGVSRAFWLGINLVNAVAVSVVIGFFEQALDTVVALAVLMPIVANMAGTASVQTLTVMVRQLALGELTPKNMLGIFRKEALISLGNGLLFGLATLAISYLWFGSLQIGVAMALSMFISFICAGIIGAGAPVLIRKLGIDPAVASSVVVITLIDVIGFFTFLWLATLLVL